VIIGLCGGSGSGKSTVAGLFSERGFLTINTDEIYHSLISRKTECRDALVSEFGNSILDGDAINRKKLALLVFGEDAKSRLKKLNQISHKFVLNEVRRIIAELDKSKYCGVIVDAPLLFESSFDKECDYIIAVIASTEIRVDRIISRDGISREDALLRISKQISNDVLAEKADFVIKNDSSNFDLKLQINKIIERMIKGV